ncbi:MAG: hypothetical protein WKG00_11990 [Polyangiaceae bacterium]
MSQLTDDLKKQLDERLAELATLRDEVRVQVHLAGMDAKKRWDSLETEVFEAEGSAKGAVSDVTHAALVAAVSKLTAFRDTLKGMVGETKDES